MLPNLDLGLDAKKVKFDETSNSVSSSSLTTPKFDKINQLNSKAQENLSSKFIIEEASQG